MIDRNSWSGAITVYLSLILSAVILLSGVLMDIVRIKAAEVQVRRAVNTAAISALAGYHTKLKEDYGLFTLYDNESVKLAETIKSYLQKNLLTELGESDRSKSVYDFLKSIIVNNEYKDVHFIDLYDYRIESVQVLPIYNLTENEISRQQIAEYMKYRAPAQFAENFMEKINYVSDTADITDAYKQKTIIDKKLAKVEKALTRLQKEIDEMNKFDKSKFDNVLSSNSLIETYIESEMQQSVYAVYSSIEIGTSENENEQEKTEELSEYAAELYRDASQNSNEKRKQLEEHLKNCLAAARAASGEVETVKALMKTLQSDINTLKNSLQELEKNNREDKPQIIDALKQDIKKWEQLVDSENSSIIQDALERDIILLNNINDSMGAIPRLVSSQTEDLRSQAKDNMRKAIEADGALDISGTLEFNTAIRKVLSAPAISGINSSAESFETIKEVLIKGVKKQGKDPRKTIANDAKEIKADIKKISKISKNIEEPKLLPSYSINGTYPNKIFSEGLLQAEQDEVNTSTEANDFEVDFDEESSFSENTFGYITYLTSALEQYAKNTRNEIYVNEYILKTFKDAVEIKDSATDNKIRDTLFDKAEVEYILSGLPSEQMNLLNIRGKILLIRFGMNTLHVYSDPQKRLKALEIATAAAGLTGFGIPIAQNLIMCSWGMAEAFQDMNDIYQGKRVAFIKTVQTWRTDLIPGGYKIDNDALNQGSLMDFDYHDYLRLLLLVENKDIKMNRIEDLIQVNMQKSSPEFKLSDYNTYVKVNVQISMKYWFLTKIFVPSRLKTSSGRHLINIEAWKGY